MASNDRLFIKKYDSFIYTVRNIIYFGNAYKTSEAPDPKHERLRFINYFGWETNEQYYDSAEKSFSFSNDEKLKDEFANIYTYKTMLIPEMGDSLQLFSALGEEEFLKASDISETRHKGHFNSIINKESEIFNSGSIIVKGQKPFLYKKNIDILSSLTDDEKQDFLKALDFAIKKNNFTSFASTYKKLVSCRDGIEAESCETDIDHQLFHPILDELHIWEAVSAISEKEKIDIIYIIKGENRIEFSGVIPLKIVYDNIYGRSYLFCFNLSTNDYSVFRFDRIFSLSSGEKADEWLIEEKTAELEKRLETAWLVSLNPETTRVKIRFKNTVALRERVKNEGRHGKITAFDGDGFIFEIDVNDPLETVNWVLNFGADCTVIEPPALVDKIIEHLEGMAK